MRKSKIMDCHYVPQVYQKRWRVQNTKKSVYFLLKKDKYLSSKDTTVNVKKNLCLDDYYILPLENKYLLPFYIQAFPSFFENVMRSYDNMEIVYHKKNIECKTEFINNFIHFRKFKIINNNNVLNNTIEWEKIKQLWNNEYAKKLEDSFWNIENNWNKILDNVIEDLDNNIRSKISINRDSLIQFIAIQSIRIYDSPLIKKTINESCNIVASIIDKNVLPNPKSFLSRHKKDIWIKELMKYYFNINAITLNYSKSNNSVSSLIEHMKNCQIFIIKAIGRARFITSDRPVINVDSKTSSGSLTIMPLSPDYCLFLANNKFDKNAINRYDILEANNPIVGYINNLMCTHSREGIICNEKIFYRNRIYPKKYLEKMFGMQGYLNAF